ncbi:unnamed protein product [Amaranthus hypochondriacus]
MDQNQKTSSSKKRHRIVAMPYPGRGHINPMLNLCKLILSKSDNLSITFVVTEEWLGFLSAEAQEKPLPENLSLAAVPQVIPLEKGRAANIMEFVQALLTKLQDPFERLLDRLEPKPIAIIYDVILSWMVGVGNERNIALASLVTVSSSFFTILSHFDLLVQHGHVPLHVSEKETYKLNRQDEALDYIPGIPSLTFADLPPSFQKDGKKLLNQMVNMVSATNNAQYILITSIYEFDEQAIHSLKTKFHVPFYQIGPMIPYFSNQDHKTHHYFHWLDSQPKGSVLYISQGSYLSLSNDQVQEIILGIQDSDVPFLWVTRGEIETLGGVDNAKGLFVPWCDQLRVLCHPSIGGFWTHCGWNSSSEGFYGGVPMLTCPIAWDQFLHSRMIVDDLKIGWNMLKNDAHVVPRQEIAEIVSKFMDPECYERKEMVKRAKEVGNMFRQAMDDGGSAALDFDAFINDVMPKHD